MFLRGLSLFLLFAAFALLLVVSLSAPIIDYLGFLHVKPGNMVYRFGAWGMCQTTGNNKCTPSSLGYDLTGQLTTLVNNNSVRIHESLTGATKVNVLVPIASGVSLLAMTVAWMSSKLGFFFASFISVFAFLISLAAMAAEFAIYGMAKNDMKAGGIKAEFGGAMWMVLVATICLLLAALTSLFQCCCGHRRESRDGRIKY